MPKIGNGNTGDSGDINLNPEDLLKTYPTFFSAGDALLSAAGSLQTALNNATSAFDGDTQKKLTTIGDTCVKNLRDLSQSMTAIGERLHWTATEATHVD